MMRAVFVAFYFVVQYSTKNNTNMFCANEDINCSSICDERRLWKISCIIIIKNSSINIISDQFSVLESTKLFYSVQCHLKLRIYT